MERIEETIVIQARFTGGYLCTATGLVDGRASKVTPDDVLDWLHRLLTELEFQVSTHLAK